MIDKPQPTLEIKYSKVLTVLIIDVVNYQLMSPPLVSIFLLILQYTTDKLFYTKRYSDSSSLGVQEAKSMINSLQVVPKLLIFTFIGNYLRPFDFRENFSHYGFIWVTEMSLLVLIFVPFGSLSGFILKRFFPFEKKQKEVKIDGRVDAGGKECSLDEVQFSENLGNSLVASRIEMGRVKGVESNLKDLLLGSTN